MREELFWILLSKKIAGEATAQELEQLHQLITAYPECKTSMENLQELWDTKPKPNANKEDNHRLELAYLTHINRLNEYKGADTPIHEQAVVKRPLRRLFSIAAILLLAIGTTVIWRQHSFKPIVSTAKPENEISISPGSRSKIQLPDGSTVWINSGSRLTYGNAFTGSTREVYLNGEAFFEVVKNPRHPFIVHTTGIDIKVLGTAFNVKAYDQEPTIEATLLHGAIEVIKKNQPAAPRVLLKPHEKLVYNKNEANMLPVASNRSNQTLPASQITIQPLRNNKPDSVLAETAWVYNKLIFEEERLDELARRMERWYNVRIDIMDESLKVYKISGSFVNETIAEALQELQYLLPFSYTINEGIVRIKRK